MSATAGAAIATGMAAAAGSVASQLVGMAIGAQEGFSWKSVATAALSAGIGKGIAGGPVGQSLHIGTDAAKWYHVAVNAAVTNVVTQGVLVAAGLQEKFSWKEVAISAAAAPAAKWAGEQASGWLADSGAAQRLGDFGSRLTVHLAQGATSGAVRAALGGKVDFASIVVDAFGNALGESVASRLNGPPKPAAAAVDTLRSGVEEVNPDGLALYDRLIESGQFTPQVAARIASNPNFVGGVNGLQSDDATVARMIEEGRSFTEIFATDPDATSADGQVLHNKRDGTAVAVHGGDTVGMRTLRRMGQLHHGYEELKKDLHIEQIIMAAQFAMGPLAATKSLLVAVAGDAVVGKYVEQGIDAVATGITAMAHKSSYETAHQVLTFDGKGFVESRPGELEEWTSLRGGLTTTHEGSKFLVGAIAMILLGVAAKSMTGKADADGAGGGSGTTAGIRPTWRQSEIDVGYPLKSQGYRPQVSFKNGVEVPYGTKGSVRPEFYKDGSSIEVKNYNLETAKGRNRLVGNVSEQAKSRASNLPSGTLQEIHLDVRGQNVSRIDLNKVIEQIVKNSNGALKADNIKVIR